MLFESNVEAPVSDTHSIESSGFCDQCDNEIMSLFCI